MTESNFPIKLILGAVRVAAAVTTAAAAEKKLAVPTFIYRFLCLDIELYSRVTLCILQ
jgi:hypothetical protein